MGLTPTISKLDGDGSDGQSRQDRRLAFAHRLLRVGWAMMFGLTGTARVGKLLELCNHDMNTLNFCNTTLWTAGNVSIALVSPLIGAMSDAFGRVPILLQGRLGQIAWLWGTAASTKLWHYMLADMLSWGLVSASILSVEDAFFADAFGERPELSGRVRARNGVWSGIAGFVTPFAGIWLASKSRNLAFHIGAGMCFLQILVVLWHGETLSAPDRKPLTVAAANPFNSFLLLFNNGPGLARLGAAAACYTGVTTSWGTQEAYQFGAIGMTAAENSIFDAVFQASGAASQAWVVQPLLKRLGNRRCFEYSSVFAALAYVLVGQAWRPAGADKLRRVGQYALCMALLQSPWSEPSFFCIQPMVVKQALHQTNAGKGQITAAFGMLEAVLGAGGALLWGVLQRFFISNGAPWWLAWGPGGHFAVCGLVRLLGALILRTTPDKHLHLDEADEAGGEGLACKTLTEGGKRWQGWAAEDMRMRVRAAAAAATEML